MRRYKTNCKSDFLREVTEIIIMMLSPDEEMKGTILTVCHRSTEIDFESDQITISGTGMSPSSTSSSRVDTVGIEGGTIIIEITSSWCILVGIIDAKHYIYNDDGEAERPCRKSNGSLKQPLALFTIENDLMQKREEDGEGAIGG